MNDGLRFGTTPDQRFTSENLLQFKNLAHFESTFISSQQRVVGRLYVERIIIKVARLDQNLTKWDTGHRKKLYRVSKLQTTDT